MGAARRRITEPAAGAAGISPGGIPRGRVFPLVPLFCAVLLLSPFAVPRVPAEGSDQALPGILAAAESFFRAMERRDYPGVWGMTTAASKAAIVDDTFRAIERGGGTEIPREEVRRDFDATGPLARRYWEGFLARFDPGIALERSRWEKGRIDADRAEILITARAAEKPARLLLFLEGDGWKVGVAESFWGRKE